MARIRTVAVAGAWGGGVLAVTSIAALACWAAVVVGGLASAVDGWVKVSVAFLPAVAVLAAAVALAVPRRPLARRASLVAAALGGLLALAGGVVMARHAVPGPQRLREEVARISLPAGERSVLLRVVGAARCRPECPTAVLVTRGPQLLAWIARLHGVGYRAASIEPAPFAPGQGWFGVDGKFRATVVLVPASGRPWSGCRTRAG
jgi:hypothetical protein